MTIQVFFYFWNVFLDDSFECQLYPIVLFSSFETPFKITLFLLCLSSISNIFLSAPLYSFTPFLFPQLPFLPLLNFHLSLFSLGPCNLVNSKMISISIFLLHSTYSFYSFLAYGLFILTLEYLIQGVLFFYSPKCLSI